MGRVGNAPEQERVLTEIGRQRSIKQSVFLMMLQKREDTAMELANVTDKGKWVDDAHYVNHSNKPRKSIVLIISLFFSVIIPIIVLFILELINSKLKQKVI